MRGFLQSFSLGILVATIILSVIYFNESEKDRDVTEKMTEIDMKAQLEEQGYHILTTEQFEKLQAQKSPEVNNDSDLPVAEKNDAQEKVTFLLEINSGMNSESISRLLKEEGIIKDSKEFDEYLQETGYSIKIQIGSYELSSTMSYKEIAQRITKSM